MTDKVKTNARTFTTPKGRIIFPRLFTPDSELGNPRYGVNLLFPKDTTDMKRFVASMRAAIEEAAKVQPKFIPREIRTDKNFRSNPLASKYWTLEHFVSLHDGCTLRDGDQKAEENPDKYSYYADHWYCSANRPVEKGAPPVYDSHEKDENGKMLRWTLDNGGKEQCYFGRNASAQLFCGYNEAFSTVFFYLNSLMVLPGGENIGSGYSDNPEEAYSEYTTTSYLD